PSRPVRSPVPSPGGADHAVETTNKPGNGRRSKSPAVQSRTTSKQEKKDTCSGRLLKPSSKNSTGEITACSKKTAVGDRGKQQETQHLHHVQATRAASPAGVGNHNGEANPNGSKKSHHQPGASTTNTISRSVSLGARGYVSPRILNAFSPGAAGHNITLGGGGGGQQLQPRASPRTATALPSSA
ncbi:unnamed protein product, partial [Amoebophrya sp. A25]